MSKRVTLVEVGPRDGLQNESLALNPSARTNLIKRLALTGLQRIEVGAFVSPQKVPQMAGSLEVARKVLQQQARGIISKKISFSALVPNAKGMDMAQRSGIKGIAFFTSASQTFNQKNTNCTLQESLQRLEDILEMMSHQYKLRSYISMAFYCPYEGHIRPQAVVKLAERLIMMGCDEISLGDTIGVASPKEVGHLLSLLLKKLPSKRIAMHFHNTRGMALANIKESLDHGIRVFDTSIGGLGGCPYAKGATGNVATEDVAYFLKRLGYLTGVDIPSLVQIHHWLKKKLKHDLPSQIGRLPNPTFPL